LRGFSHAGSKGLGVRRTQFLRGDLSAALQAQNMENNGSRLKREEKILNKASQAENGPAPLSKGLCEMPWKHGGA